MLFHRRQNAKIALKPYSVVVADIILNKSLDPTGRPNSSEDLVDGDGKVIQRRYYGPDGKAEFDVDYTNHGNPNAHPTVPHGHEWRWDLNPKNPPRPEVKLPW